MMSEEMVPAIDVARALGKRKSSIFKIMKRLRIRGVKRRDSSKGGQLVTHITREEAGRVRSEVFATARPNQSTENGVEGDGSVSAEEGVFYLIQLEPDHDPRRFKVGWAVNISERLRALRCSAPFATTLKTWPCRRTWEQTAIDCVTANCEQIHTEVFRTDSLEEIAARCDKFFGMMPVRADSTHEE